MLYKLQGKPEKLKKAHYTWCRRQWCWLKRSMLNEIVIQHRWEHWPRTAVVTADYTSSTLWDITPSKKRRKVLCFLKKQISLWQFRNGGCRECYLTFKLQKPVIISAFFSGWLDLRAGSWLGRTGLASSVFLCFMAPMHDPVENTLSQIKIPMALEF